MIVSIPSIAQTKADHLVAAQKHIINEAVVPVEAVQKLVEGSMEQFTAYLDEAVLNETHKFDLDEGETAGRLATFDDRVVVGTSGGRYFQVPYSVGKDGFEFGEAEQLDVPVMESITDPKNLRDYTFSIVDSILSEDVDVAASKLVSLTSLYESMESSERDYVAEVMAALAGERPWRAVYNEQRNDITRHVLDRIESIRESQLEARYAPLYEGDEIPEERFEDFRESVDSDLSVLAHRLEAVHHAVESSYFPFRESVDLDDLTEDDEVVGHFCFFAEDLMEDMQELRQLVAEAMQHEQCVMCLGHIYDSIAESLVDYEVAGAFVERMVTTSVPGEAG